MTVDCVFRFQSHDSDDSLSVEYAAPSDGKWLKLGSVWRSMDGKWHVSERSWLASSDMDYASRADAIGALLHRNLG